jgi:small subunit ribosomal protein S9
MTTDEQRFHYGVGRRKTASAQVRLYTDGDGAILVNGRSVEAYFTRHGDLQAVSAPLEAAGVSRYTVTCQVTGGGPSGQVGAVQLGIARALVEADPNLVSTLRRGGYLTRDPREKERKKPGLKRARKAPQYTKR